MIGLRRLKTSNPSTPQMTDAYILMTIRNSSLSRRSLSFLISHQLWSDCRLWVVKGRLQHCQWWFGMCRSRRTSVWWCRRWRYQAVYLQYMCTASLVCQTHGNRQGSYPHFAAIQLGRFDYADCIRIETIFYLHSLLKSSHCIISALLSEAIFMVAELFCNICWAGISGDNWKVYCQPRMTK